MKTLRLSGLLIKIWCMLKNQVLKYGVQGDEKWKPHSQRAKEENESESNHQDHHKIALWL